MSSPNTTDILVTMAVLLAFFAVGMASGWLLASSF
tara:strand:- start:6552 stop:6656 length:105 start_codon:yes stop_codon:yes gene_type:complete